MSAQSPVSTGFYSASPLDFVSRLRYRVAGSASSRPTRSLEAGLGRGAGGATAGSGMESGSAAGAGPAPTQRIKGRDA